MPTIFTYWTLAMCLTFLFFMLSTKRYRLLLPSTLHSIAWSITALIMIFQIKRIFVSSNFSEQTFSLSAKYMCYIIASSIVGFVCAHVLTENRKLVGTEQIDTCVLDTILKRFRWIQYFCALIGVLLFAFIFSTIGNVDTFSDYRGMALTVKRVGYMAVVQRISGHVNILGSFYLMLLGYKMGQKGIDVKEFAFNALLCSFINMSIGGRVWILNSTLPFFVTFFLSRYNTNLNVSALRSDIKKIFCIVISLACLFSAIGLLRDDSVGSKTFIDKFQYFSDGMRITNMVLKQYPVGSYELEYGKSEFFSSWFESPMEKRFDKSISYDIGLSVTVKSSLPFLYYDFGFSGGILAWGIICFLLEYICIRLISVRKIIGILLFGQLSCFLFQAPVFPIFSLNLPSMEWILLLYIFRRFVFRNIKNCEQYL